MIFPFFLSELNNFYYVNLFSINEWFYNILGAILYSRILRILRMSNTTHITHASIYVCMYVCMYDVCMYVCMTYVYMQRSVVVQVDPCNPSLHAFTIGNEWLHDGVLLPWHMIYDIIDTMIFFIRSFCTKFRYIHTLGPLIYMHFGVICTWAKLFCRPRSFLNNDRVPMSSLEKRHWPPWMLQQLALQQAKTNSTFPF